MKLSEEVREYNSGTKSAIYEEWADRIAALEQEMAEAQAGRKKVVDELHTQCLKLRKERDQLRQAVLAFVDEMELFRKENFMWMPEEYKAMVEIIGGKNEL